MIEQAEKFCRMRALAEMGELMQHDVIEAFGRLLAQLSVEVDVASEGDCSFPIWFSFAG